MKTIIPVSPEAAKAIHAAQLRRKCGRYPAERYCIAHNVPRNLYRLACQLLAMHLHEVREAKQQRQAELYGS